MILKRFSVLLVIRVTLILANMVLLSAIFGDERLIFNHIILLVILAFQIAELIRFVNKTNRSIARFLFAIKHDDISINLSERKSGGSFAELQSAFEEIMYTYKDAKIEKEANFHYLKHIIEHIKVGIISIENEEDIVLFNLPAERILNVMGVKNWQILGEKQRHFVKEIEKLGNEGKGLIEFTSNQEVKTLSVDISSMKSLDKQYKVITFQDIKSEIELKEIEAWHKLIRILTHEIMNSITPITSLTETMQTMLSKDGIQKPLHTLDDETIGDLLFSLKTIEKRSNGLIDFVGDYRKLTRVPQPVFEAVEVTALLQGIESLMRPTLEKEQIEMYVEIDPNLESLPLDPKLIEQVLLNLITNSKHALRGIDRPKIELKSYQINDAVFISVSDNGTGIPKKEIQEIFTPFFSTKEEGSGIGLSLSKQIMHLHSGRISVSSTPNECTSFVLKIPKNRN
jgi:nitrogen fixation/metabolism regulation signal transduction histidine kinase